MGDGRVSDPVTTAEGAGEFIVLAELSTALSGRLAGWSTDGADPDTSSTMASLAARLGEHAGWWMDRTPESVLLEGERTAASGSGRLTDILALLDIPPSERRSAVALVAVNIYSTPVSSFRPPAIAEVLQLFDDALVVFSW